VLYKNKIRYSRPAIEGISAKRKAVKDFKKIVRKIFSTN